MNEKIGITTARISGLKMPPYYCKDTGIWIFGFNLTSASRRLKQTPWYELTDESKKEAEQVCNQLKQSFSDADICDQSTVVAICREDGSVRAIAPKRKDCWIDIEDHCTKKTFKELGLDIESLIVY